MNRAIGRIAGLAALLPLAAVAGTKVGDSYHVTIPVFDEGTGKLAYEIKAARMDRDPQNEQRMLGTEVRIEIYDPGTVHVVTSDKGEVNTETKKGRLEGHVVIQFGDEAKTRVETEVLDWDGDKGVAQTDAPVTITRPDLTITGTGMDARVGRAEAGERPAAPEGAAPPGDRVVIHRNVRARVEAGSQTGLFLGPGAAKAEPAKADPEADDAKGPPAAEPPIVITSTGVKTEAGGEYRDGLTILRGRLTALFQGNVRAVQGPKTLVSDRLTLGFVRDPNAAPQQKDRVILDEMVAEGRVRIDDGETVGIGDKAIWHRDENATQLIGQPAQVTWDNGNRLAAPIIFRRRDGDEIICTPSPDQEGSVHLFTFPAPAPRPAPEGPSAPPR